MADSPFVGPSNPLASRTTSVARTVNLMPIPAPGNERVLLGFKDVEGLVEVERTIVIPPEPPTMILGLHLDNTLVEQTGLTVAGALTYSAGKFGAGSFAGLSGTNVLYTSARAVCNLGTEWMIDGWINPTDNDIVECILIMQGDNGTGGTGGAGGDARQFQLDIFPDPITGDPSLRFIYCTNPGGGGATILSSALVTYGSWNYFAIVQDATSVRMYLGTAKVGEDVRPAYNLTDWTNQVFLVGADYAGGGPPWPTANVYTNWFIGSIDDLRVMTGPGSCEYTGSTITVPTHAFQNP